MRNKTLLLFTDSYPYGKGEQYLDNEISYYCKSFNKIFFIPINRKGKIRDIPNNAKILDIHKLTSFSNINKITILPLFIIHFINEVLFTRKILTFSKLFQYYTSYYNAFAYKKSIIKWIKNGKIDPSNIVFYSYWMYHWAFVISQLKNYFKTPLTISRAHLYDTYHYLNFLPWAAYKLKKIDKIICISHHANKYLSKNHTKASDKIITSYLGVKHIGINPMNKLKKKIFVSCSSIREDKRLDYIIDVLSNLKQDIKWIHFGDGNDSNKIMKYAKKLPNNIEVCFMGHTANNKVLEYYKNEHIDLFINLSLREGIPVSIMEAISFGIPVMGTNVFGTPEIVNNKTGILININNTSKEVAIQIDRFLKSDDIDRQRILDFYNENFNADKVYNDFSKILTLQ